MTYTAVVKKTLEGWIGWVEEIPGVNCQEPTYDALLETITETLREGTRHNWFVCHTGQYLYLLNGIPGCCMRQWKSVWNGN